jgi:hypothetical protein
MKMDNPSLLKMAQTETDALPCEQDGRPGHNANKLNVAYRPNAFTLGGRVD